MKPSKRICWWKLNEEFIHVSSTLKKAQSFWNFFPLQWTRNKHILSRKGQGKFFLARALLWKPFDSGIFSKIEYTIALFYNVLYCIQKTEITEYLTFCYMYLPDKISPTYLGERSKKLLFKILTYSIKSPFPLMAFSFPRDFVNLLTLLTLSVKHTFLIHNILSLYLFFSLFYKIKVSIQSKSKGNNSVAKRRIQTRKLLDKVLYTSAKQDTM